MVLKNERSFYFMLMLENVNIFNGRQYRIG